MAEEFATAVIEMRGKVKKTIQEKTFSILKWVAVIVVIGWLGSNMFIKYSDGKILNYTNKIENNQIILDSISEEIERSKDVQKSLDEMINKSKQKSKYYENKVTILIEEYNDIREKVDKGTVSDAYNVVKQHLDSLRARNKNNKPN